MECKFCGKNIPKGTALKLEKGTPYANFKFCSEECYQSYQNDTTKTFTDKFYDIWENYCPINYPTMIKQAVAIHDEYKLTYREMGMIVKYALLYGGFKPTPNANLYWVFPYYIDEALDFMADLRARKEQELPEQTYIYIKPQTHKTYVPKEKMTWEEDD